LLSNSKCQLHRIPSHSTLTQPLPPSLFLPPPSIHSIHQTDQSIHPSSPSTVFNHKLQPQRPGPTFLTDSFRIQARMPCPNPAVKEYAAGYEPSPRPPTAPSNLASNHPNSQVSAQPQEQAQTAESQNKAASTDTAPTTPTSTNLQALSCAAPGPSCDAASPSTLQGGRGG
jgi:hypothetical protein